jgi:hypothetical protein
LRFFGRKLEKCLENTNPQKFFHESQIFLTFHLVFGRDSNSFFLVEKSQKIIS